MFAVINLKVKFSILVRLQYVPLGILSLFIVSALTGFDYSEDVPAGTHLLEVVALGYLFSPVRHLFKLLLFEVARLHVFYY